MTIAVRYDSRLGHTEAIAKAIAQGAGINLRPACEWPGGRPTRHPS
ncbi:MAG: flavodoxin family protein [Clostridia bacterium]|nr:flavodoxin family protein [Clostridia bacterium]